MGANAEVLPVRRRRSASIPLTVCCMALLALVAPQHGYAAPLHDAVSAGDGAQVSALINSGTNVNVRDPAGRTPLLIACTEGDVAIAAFLLDAGANANAADVAGETPLHVAAEQGHGPLTIVLLEHSANVSARDARGRTPLHLAALRNQPAVINALLSAGADVRVTDADGKTPLDLAIASNNEAAQATIVARMRADSFESWQRSMAYVEAMNGPCSAVPRRCPDGSIVYEKMLPPLRRESWSSTPVCRYPTCP